MKSIYIILLQKLLVSKRFYIGVFLLIALAIKTVMQLSNQISDSQNIPYLIYYQIINLNIMIWFIIPSFLFFLGIITNVFDRYQVLLKYNSSKRWWKEKIISVLLFATLYILIIHIVIFGAVIACEGTENITSNYLSFLMLSSAIQLIGLSVLGILYSIISLLSNTYIGFFIAMLFIAFMDATKRMFKFNFNTLPEYMSSLFNNEQQATTALNGIDIFSLSSFFLMVIVLYFIGLILSNDKDYFWSK